MVQLNKFLFVELDKLEQGKKGFGKRVAISSFLLCFRRAFHKNIIVS